MYSSLIPLTLSILPISTFAAPAPQYSPIALAVPATQQQYPSKYLTAPVAPAAQEYTENAQFMAPVAAIATQYSNDVQQYSPEYPSIPAAPASEAYRCYRGRDFPSDKYWLPLEALQSVNLATMQRGNTPETVAYIFQAIVVVCKEAKIDPRIVLAMVMQESSGQTFKIGDSQRSSGLMQVQPTRGEQGIRCSQTDCDYQTIIGMIEQGVLGTTRGDGPVAPGIAFWLKSYDLATAFRAYNSGQVPNWHDLSIATDRSTASYVSDMGNRLVGLAPNSFSLDRSANCGFAPTPT